MGNNKYVTDAKEATTVDGNIWEFSAIPRILRIQCDSKNFNFDILSRNQFFKFLEVTFKILRNFITEYFGTVNQW